MEEQLQLALAELLNGTIAAKDFLVAETPLVIQELLVWKLFWNSAMAVLAFTVAAACVVVAVKAYRYGTAVEHSSFDEGWAFLIGACVVCGIFSIFLTIANLKVVFMIAIAPKVYLLEYLVSVANPA